MSVCRAFLLALGPKRASLAPGTTPPPPLRHPPNPLHLSPLRLLTQLATAKAGLVLVNINPAYRPLELSYSLKKVGAHLFPVGPQLLQGATI